MGLSRRKFLAWLAATTGVGTLAPARGILARTGQKTITLTATATRTGEYLYLPFRVPSGVNRVEVGLTKDREDTRVGVGLFDQRVTLEQRIWSGDYVRAELRDEPAFEVPSVPASRGPMEALTNPIFLVQGAQPAQNEPMDAPPTTGR